jgi:DNA mismatch repair protein MutL
MLISIYPELVVNVGAKIHILEPELANKIAAGEVVQRPASVVKELIENSIDAGATSITIIVKDAGRSLIQVVDDGEGMSQEDALLAFERHATSKIAAPEDLEAIRTLGFRGEALASIAAVAHVELRTRRRIDAMGTLIRIEGSELKEQSGIGMEPGTFIAVRHLFYNTPARRNFLKTRNTELKNITDAVTRMAVAYPSLAWRYESDDEVLLDLRPASREDRLKDLFGERQFEALLRVESANEYLKIDGYVGKPHFARKSRVDQFLFINHRFVVNRAINHAVFQAYEHLLIKGQFPFYTLNIELDPRKVDVNVHPSKMEVKFENESAVYRMVLTAVRKVLGASDSAPEMAFVEQEISGTSADRLRFANTWQSRTQIPRSPVSVPPGSTQFDLSKLFGRVEQRLEEGRVERDGEATYPADLGTEKDVPRERIVQHTAQSTGTGEAEGGEARAIWQIQNKYILSQVKSGLLIIDQHVAHERILYEKVLSQFQNTLPSTQQLLFPHTVQMSASDYSLVMELKDDLAKIGFDLKLFGKNTVVIEGIPADVRVGSEARILQDVLDEFKNDEHHQMIDARDKLAKSFACKAAVKAGDKLTSAEMLVLIDQLFATQMPYVCPHGRPVMVKIPVEELDRRFGRT